MPKSTDPNLHQTGRSNAPPTLADLERDLAHYGRIIQHVATAMDRRRKYAEEQMKALEEVQYLYDHVDNKAAQKRLYNRIISNRRTNIRKNYDFSIRLSDMYDKYTQFINDTRTIINTYNREHKV
jgi:hypothetical protein